jgi:DHA1 family tetracycline resistance protein-like MFS transporter
MSDAALPPVNSTEPPKGALLAIFLIILVDFLGFGLIIPLLPFYVPDYEHNPMKVTLIFSIFSICQFIGAPVLGALSDRYGRRPVLIVSQVGSAAGYVLLGVASMPSLHWSPEARLGLVYLSRVIDGFTGGNVSTAQAYISDVTTGENRAKGMGLIGAAFGIGFSLGPFLGGVLGHYDRTWPAYAAAALALVAAIQTYLKLPESTVHKPTEAKLWFHPRTFAPVFRNSIVAQLLLISYISMAAFVMMEATIGIFLAAVFGWQDPELAARNTGLFFGYAGVVIIIVQGGLIGRLTRKLGEWPLAVLGPAMVAVGMGLYSWIAWHRALWVLLVAGAVNSAGRSLQGPTVSSLLSKHSDPREQGVVFGLYHGLMSLARVIGPIVAGVTYPLWRNTGQFWTAGVMVVIAAVWTAGVWGRAREARGGAMNGRAVAEAAKSEIE